MLKGFLLCLTVFVLAACGAADTTAPVAPPAPPVTQPPTSVSLTIAVNFTQISVGQTAVATATVKLSTGQLMTSGSVSWSSSDPNIAAVAPNGSRSATVTALGPGIAEIYATIDNLSDKILLPIAPRATVGVGPTSFLYTESEGFVFIQPPAGADGIEARALNDAGQVVGRILYASGSESHAFMWTRADGLKDLGTMPGSTKAETVANAISENGQVVGWSASTSGNIHAFRWTAETGMRDLGLPAGSLHSYATGVNKAGQVVGWSAAMDGVRAFRWSEERGMEAISAADASAFTRATAINEGGQVVGAATLPGDPYPLDDNGAIIWSASGVRTDILYCKVAPYTACEAASAAINTAGVVVGTDGSNAFIWADDEMRVIPGLPVGGYSIATAINDAGIVVGNISGPTEWGFIWSEAGGYRELNPPAGHKEIQVTDINNKNQIVGYFQ